MQRQQNEQNEGKIPLMQKFFAPIKQLLFTPVYENGEHSQVLDSTLLEMLIKNIGSVVLTRLKFLHVDIQQMNDNKQQKFIWEQYQDQFEAILRSEIFNNYLRQLISEMMTKEIDTDLEERKNILIKQGLNKEKIMSSEWYQLLAFDKVLNRSFDNFISLQ